MVEVEWTKEKIINSVCAWTEPDRDLLRARKCMISVNYIDFHSTDRKKKSQVEYDMGIDTWW